MLLIPSNVAKMLAVKVGECLLSDSSLQGSPPVFSGIAGKFTMTSQ
jgi:hypothetical protein